MRVAVNDRAFANGKDAVSSVYFSPSWDFLKDIFLMADYTMTRTNKLS